MWGNATTAPSVGLYHSVQGIKEAILGVNERYAPGPTQVVDDRLGYRLNQPRAVQTTRMPTVQIIARFKSNSMGLPVRHEIEPIHNVTAVYYIKAHISGLAIPHNNLHLKFQGTSDREALNTNSSIHIGMPRTKNEGIIVESDPTQTDVLFNAGFSPIIYAQFRQPKELTSVSVEVQDLDGLAALYDELVVWFLMETEIWQ
jgi:hypothetical protein